MDDAGPRTIQRREYERARRATRIATGTCAFCLNPLATKWLCRDCADRQSKRATAIREARKAGGLCIVCGDPAINRNHCREHARRSAATALACWNRRKARAKPS